ncbi:MAG: LPD23 domain-containing protein, partial [Acutalibacteraceae bacterium]
MSNSVWDKNWQSAYNKFRQKKENGKIKEDENFYNGQKSNGGNWDENWQSAYERFRQQRNQTRHEAYQQSEIRAEKRAREEEQKEIDRFNALSDADKLKYISDQKASKRDEFLNSEEYNSKKGLLKSLLPGGTTPSEWAENRKKKNTLEDEAEDAQNAYKSYLSYEQKQKARTLDVDKLEKNISELENEKEQIPGRISGALNYVGAALSGDSDKASDIHEQNEKNYVKRNEIDSQLALYRSVYSDVKSKEEISKLPEDVIDLLDEYNNIKYKEENNRIQGISNVIGGIDNTLNLSNSETAERKNQIQQELVKKGYENFEELASYRKYQTEKAQNEKDTADLESFATEHPVISSVGTVITAPAAAVSGMIGNIKRADDNEFAEDEYNPYYYLTRANSEIRGTVGNNFESGVVNRDVKKMLYDTTMSGADSAVASFLPGGELLLGASVMNETAIEMTEKGATASQALTSGLVAGAFEGLFEHLSIGQMKALREVAPKSVKDVVKNIAKSTVTNFSEESATELADILYDYLANGGISDYAESVNSYIEDGADESTAKKYAAKDMGKRVLDSGISGALMGGVFGVAGSAIGSANYNNQLKDAGRNITENGDIETLLASAYNFEDKDETISKLARKIAQNEEAYNNSITENENSDEKLTERKYKGSELKNIGKLSESLLDYYETQKSEILKSSVSQRLSELGESEESIGEITDAVVNAISDSSASLSRKESALLNSSKTAKKVLSEYYDATLNELNSKTPSWIFETADKISDITEKISNPDIEAYRNRKKSNDSYVNPDSDNIISEQSTIDDVIKANEGKYTSYASQLIKSLYNDGLEHNPTAFEKDFELYYSYGKIGEAFDNVVSRETADPNFSQRLKKEAYNAGIRASEIGKQTKLASITKISDSDIVVKDSQGNEVSLGETNADEATVRLYKSAAALKDIDAANTYISGYTPKVNFQSYSSAFDSFYSAGANSGMSFESFMKNNPDYSELYDYLSSKTAKDAFEFGRKVVSQTSKTRQIKPDISKKATGKYYNQTISDKALDSFYEAVAAKTGMNIVKRESIFTPDGLEANAQFITDAFTAVVSANASSEFTDFVHELNHANAAYNKKGYAAVKAACVSYYTDKNGYTGFEEKVQEIMTAYGDISREDAIEELVSEAVAGIFAKEGGAEDFINWLKTDSKYTEPQKKSIIQKIADIFKTILDAIKKLIADGQLSDTAKEFAQMEADKAHEIRMIFLKALDETAENYKKGIETQGKTKNSYAGIKSETADSKSLLKAEDLLDRGTDSDIVRKETGWFKGMDGKMRYEIDDSKMKIKSVKITDHTTLSDILEHSELFEAYPELKNVRIGMLSSIEMGGASGEYSRKDNMIVLSKSLLNSGYEKAIERILNSKEYKTYQQKIKDKADEITAKRKEIHEGLKKVEKSIEYETYIDDFYNSEDDSDEAYTRAREKFDKTEVGKRYNELVNASNQLNLEEELEKLDNEFNNSEAGKELKKLKNMNKVILNNNAETREVLIHEIQHAIQRKEGFTAGSTPEFWKEVENNYTEGEFKRLNQNKAKYDSIMNQLYDFYGLKAYDLVKEYIQLDKEWFENDLSQKREDEIIIRSNEIEKYAQEHGFIEELNAAYESMSEIDSAHKLIDKRKERSPEALYYDTAGEIEARDTESRVNLSKEERQNKKPDVYRNNYVFSDGFYKDNNGKVLYSLKGVSREEVNKLQSIGKKSVNQFSDDDIKKSEKWAKIFYRDLGEKSPFFRSWFGDWREYDRTLVEVAKVKGFVRGQTKNLDTGWNINVSGKVSNETHHYSKQSVSALPYIEYINDIVQKAVLLDTYSIFPSKSENSLFMHSFYAIADIGNGKQLLKLYVEEMLDPNSEKTGKRAYKLKNIEKQQIGVRSSHKSASSITQSADIKTISDLFKVVKQKDKDFKPNKANKLLLNENGTPMILYHGTFDNFTEFKQSELRSREGSFFFAQNKEDAEAYGDNIMPVYVKLNNPIDYNDMPSEIYRLTDKKSQVEALKKLGYDGWIADMDTGWGEVSAFYPEQIKSAEINQGTFNKENPDIRYSLRHSLGITELEKQNKSLLRQNREFERIIDDLQRQIKNPEWNHIVDFDKVKAVARKLKNEYNSTINITELSSDLGDFFNMFANSKEINQDIINTQISDIAHKILKSSKNMQPQISEYSRTILKDIRSVGITLSDEQKQEAANRFGSYNEFKKASFGSLSLRNNGVSLDTRWQELCETYPGVFDKNVSEADQAVLLFETVKALKNTYNDENGFDYDSALDMLTGEIYEAYFEVPETKSLSSDYQRKLAKAKVEYRENLDAAKRQYKKENLEMLRAARQEYGKNLAGIRRDFDEQLLKNKARYEQRVNNMADTNLRAKARENIKRRVKRLDVLLRKPTSTNHIPEGFQKAVLDLCSMFTENTSVFDYERLDDVRKAYAAIRANSPEEETSISGSYDFDIEDDLERLKKFIKGKRLSQLSLSELSTIRDILDHFSAVIKNETEIFVDGKKQYFDTVGSKALREMQAKGIKRSRLGDNKLKTMYAVDNLTPVYAFKEVGGTLETMFDDIRKGQDKYVKNLQPAKKFLENTFEKYHVKSWLDISGDVLELKTSRGEELTFTREQAMLIFATAKREQMSGQESKHLLSGGIVYEDQIVKNKKNGGKP